MNQPEKKIDKNTPETIKPENKSNSKTKTGLIIFLIVFIVLALISISVAGYFYYNWQSNKVEQGEVQEEQVEEAENQEDLSNNAEEIIEEENLNIDTDKDGLIDSEEEELGTDPEKKDTDGDGYSDKEEIDSNNDLLTASNNSNSSDSSNSSDTDSTPTSTNSTNLQPTDLTYQGAFKLPYDFDWGARGMALYSQGGTNYLLVTGPDGDKASFGRVDIPSLTKASSWDGLANEATMISGLTDFGASIVNSVDTETAWVSGLEYVAQQGTQTSGKLYGSIDDWYGVNDETHSTIWFSNIDGSSPRGPFHVGSSTDNDYHGNKSGDYLFQVPAWYANEYLGGRTLMTGKSRGSYFGSQGPTLLAFDPATSDSPSGDLDALSVLYYRIKNECASPNVTNKAVCDFPNFTFCDKWEGGSFVENGDKRAIMIYGEKGLGDNNYGTPPAGSCVESKGYYCDPQERQVLFYDVDQIGEAAQGERDPWSVVPYKTWRPDEFFLGDSSGHTCGQAGDMTYDSENKLLYIIEKGCGDNNSGAVHVYSVN